MTAIGEGMRRVTQTLPLLVVSDIDNSTAFYRDGLGFELAEHWSPNGRLAWCRIERGTAGLMLQQACDDDPPAGTCGKGVTFYFICDDADAIYQEITGRGVTATQPEVAFYGMNQTFVTDPDGYQLCFENPICGTPESSQQV